MEKQQGMKIYRILIINTLRTEGKIWTVAQPKE